MMAYLPLQEDPKIEWGGGMENQESQAQMIFVILPFMYLFYKTVKKNWPRQII